MYFNRMKAYYERQSSGRYSIAGGVHGWVQVPFNEARYGRDFSGSIVCSNVWFLIRDGLAYWVQDELATGRSMASIQDELRSYDVEDRYDSDFDGNFREPDGFIDHFQIVHAGGDQAASDPSQGTDAIWSHRSQVGLETGPGVNPGVEVGRGGVSSGVTIPTNLTGMWVGDYSIQPENGGLGVFAHEYAHDLGLPDLYDTSGNTGGAENNTAFWTHSDDPANDQSGFNQLGGGITGTSTGWEPMSVALPGSGSKLLRVRYRTDGAVVGLGFSIDDIAITGSAVDGAETGNEGWAYTRFERIDGVFKTLNPSVYIAEYKTHTGYDAVPRNGVQLRLPRFEAGLGRDPSLRRGAPRQLLERHIRGQQRRRAPGRGPAPPRGCAPDVVPRLGRPPSAEPGAVVRLGLRAEAGPVDHGAQEQPADDDAGPSGQPAVRRHGLVLVGERRSRRRGRPARRPLPAGLVLGPHAELRHADPRRRPERRQDDRARPARALATPAITSRRAGRPQRRPARFAGWAPDGRALSADT